MMHQRRQHTPEQRAAILAEWEASGAHASVIAETHGIATCTLYWWRRMARAGEPGPEQPSFAQVHVRTSSPVAEAGDDDRVEIVIGDAAVRVGPACDIELIARVVSAVRRAS